MDAVEIEQPSQNSESHSYRIAAWYKRWIAALLDTLVIGLLTAPIVLLLSDEISYQQRAALPSFVIMVGYFYYFHKKSGQTPGKKLLGIKVVSSTPGESMQLGLRETLGRFMSSAFFNLGYLWILFDRRRQGWHDKIGNTIVVDIKT